MLDKLRAILEGEPLRMISYGAVVVVWVVTHALAGRFGLPSIAPDVDAILVAVTAAIAVVTEAARRFVYSPATVRRMS